MANAFRAASIVLCAIAFALLAVGLDMLAVGPGRDRAGGILGALVGIGTLYAAYVLLRAGRRASKVAVSDRAQSALNATRRKRVRRVAVL